MKIRLAQMEVIPGNPKLNFQKAATITANAIRDNVELLVFPELCISGYLIGDMWEESSFINDCMSYGEELAKMSTASMAIIFGNVAFIDSHGTDGRRMKINAAFYAQDGIFRNIGNFTAQPKILLPNYREFEEPRHFQPMENIISGGVSSYLRPVDVNGVSIGITICEDGWDRDYPIKPTQILANYGAELILNLSCSPFTAGKNIARDKTFAAHARDNKIPLMYVNTVGCQNNGKTVFTFDGSSVVYNHNGMTIKNAPMFEECTMDFDYVGGQIMNYDTSTSNEIDGDDTNNQTAPIHEIYKGLVYGLRQYMKQCGLKRVVIGSSGGIDSAVAAALYAEVVGKENLLLVNMPSQYNSATTIGLSKQLADNLGCYYTTIPIGDSVALTANQINGLVISNGDNTMDMTLQLSNFDFENVQARDRSSRILSALSAAFGGVFTNNGNKTEATVGYCTLYGDHAGFLAAIGDLWKTQVYELGQYLNRNAEIIPEGIFTVIPSAELSADQSIDAGKGDPIKYWYHDLLFRAWVERWNRATPDDVIGWYFNGQLLKQLGLEENDDRLKILFKTNKEFIDDLERWWKLFKGMGVAKRVQAPPVLAVTRRAFGFDYRETLNCVYFGRKYEQVKEILLKIDNEV